MYLIDLIKYYVLRELDKATNHINLSLRKTFFMPEKSRGVGAENAPPAVSHHPLDSQPKHPQTFSVERDLSTEYLNDFSDEVSKGYSGVDPTEDDDKYVWYCQMMRSRRLVPMTHAKYTQWQESLSALYRDSDGCPVTKVADRMTEKMMEHAKENHYASKER